MTVLPFGSHSIEEVRAACRQEMHDYRLSIAAAAREMGRGVSAGTLSAWLSDTYKGDVPAVTARIRKWLDTRREARANSVREAGLDRHRDLLATEEIAAALAHAQATGDIAVVHGRSGTGKSWALDHYAASRVGVHAVTVSAICATPLDLLSRVSEAVGGGGKHRSARDAEAAVIGRLRGRQALLVVDEAEHLSALLLDQLRCIRDASRCGLALAGRDLLWTKICGSERLEPLRGRVGWRASLGVEPADADALAAGVLGRDPTASEQTIVEGWAALDGGMHALRRRLIDAWIIATNDADGVIETRHMRMAGEAV